MKDVIKPKCPISVGFKKRELAVRPNKHYGIKALSIFVNRLIEYMQQTEILGRAPAKAYAN